MNAMPASVGGTADGGRAIGRSDKSQLTFDEPRRKRDNGHLNIRGIPALR
jgi:hypothetical protein